MRINNYTGINKQSLLKNKKKVQKEDPMNPGDKVSIGKNDGDFLPENLKEFHNMGKRYKASGPSFRGGYFMPAEDKEPLGNKERELKGEIKSDANLGWPEVKWSKSEKFKYDLGFTGAGLLGFTGAAETVFSAAPIMALVKGIIPPTMKAEMIIGSCLIAGAGITSLTLSHVIRKSIQKRIDKKIEETRQKGNLTG